jgi:hypothetical protein
MDKTYPSKTRMVVGALEKDTESFWPRQKDKRYWVLNIHT